MTRTVTPVQFFDTEAPAAELDVTHPDPLTTRPVHPRDAKSLSTADGSSDEPSPVDLAAVEEEREPVPQVSEDSAPGKKTSGKAGKGKAQPEPDPGTDLPF